MLGVSKNRGRAVKSLLTILIIVFLSTCVYALPAIPKYKSKDVFLILDTSLEKNDKISPAWIMYGGTRLYWVQDKYFKVHPKAKEYHYSFDEELDNRTSPNPNVGHSPLQPKWWTKTLVNLRDDDLIDGTTAQKKSKPKESINQIQL